MGYKSHRRFLRFFIPVTFYVFERFLYCQLFIFLKTFIECYITSRSSRSTFEATETNKQA